MTDWSEAEIDWGGSQPSLEIVAKVRADIAQCLTDLPRPSALAYHCVWLTSDYGGPSVVLWGVRHVDHFFAEYNQITEFVSFAELEEMIESEERGDPYFGDDDA